MNTKNSAIIKENVGEESIYCNYKTYRFFKKKEYRRNIGRLRTISELKRSIEFRNKKGNLGLAKIAHGVNTSACIRSHRARFFLEKGPPQQPTFLIHSVEQPDYDMIKKRYFPTSAWFLMLLSGDIS